MRCAVEWIGGRMSAPASLVTELAAPAPVGGLTAEVKRELCAVDERSSVVRKAEVATFVRLAGGLRVIGGRVVVHAEADHPRIAHRIQRDLHDLYGCTAQVQHAMHDGSRVPGPMHVNVIKDAERLARHIGLIDQWGRPVFGSPRPLTGSGNDESEALWRGAFLAVGRLHRTGASVGLDINCPGPEVGSVLVDAADDLGVSAKTRVVRGVNRVRVRDGQQVRNLLCRIGAPQTGRLWLEQQLRSASTHMGHSNFESANARRCSDAAAVTVSRVRRAMVVLGDSIPAHLAEAGRLRLDHPSASLAELGQLAAPPLSKDAVAGRIRRLLGLAELATRQMSLACDRSAVGDR